MRICHIYCPSAVRRKHNEGEADIFTRPAFNRSRARVCLGALLALCGTSPVRAQSLSSFHRVPGTDGLNIWVGGSVGTYTANANENIHGSLRMIGLQWTHDLFAFKRARFSWVIEALPLLLVNSAAPTSRVPLTLLDPHRVADPARLARYLSHDSFGFGIAPLSAQAEVSLRPRWSTVWQVTSGAAWFSKVVPYGKATQANFTVSPGVSLQWDASRSTRVAFGYTMHHLSNASLGNANPGMNSHVFYTRFTGRRRE